MHLKGAPIEAPYSNLAYPNFVPYEIIDNRIWCHHHLDQHNVKKGTPDPVNRAKMSTLIHRICFFRRINKPALVSPLPQLSFVDGRPRALSENEQTGPIFEPPAVDLFTIISTVPWRCDALTCRVNASLLAT